MSARALQLHREDEPQHGVAGWFLPGGEASTWLEELGRWAGVQSELRLYPVPRDAGSTVPAGLLVIPSAGHKAPEGWRGVPLGVVEGRLYLPVDAVIFPPAMPAEVRTLCRAEITFFHPGLGLAEFRAADARGVWDLLEPPALASANWNAARSSTALSSRLVAVALLALPEGGEIFGDAEKEIGTDPPTRLPRRAKEPSAGPAGKIGRTMTEWGAGAVQKILSWLPAGSPRRTWVNDAMDWAAAKLAGISREMEELRHRELHRLMDMLESDPERGLRHALPLGGSPGRGLATPGAHLGNRDVRFNLSGAHGGGPVDPWDVPWEIRQKLTARYRDLALRERQLGRFQRAAYIYAQLLGDWSSAAAVLKEGRHFAEAAVVFRDHLQQPRAAAECFAEGGLFGEAIAIYEKEKLFLELGDLHRRLGDEAAAVIAWRKVVEQRIAAGDLLGAAGLLEERLQVPDEALTLLGKAWFGAPQAAQCLSAQFTLFAKLGRHEAARQRVVQLRDEATPDRHLITLAEVLGSVRKTYPDAGLRPLVADVARVKISGRLTADDAAQLRAGVRILSDLAPEDRLLARDTSRFLAARLDALNRRAPLALPPPPPRKPGSNRVGPPVMVANFRLPKPARVLAVKRCGHHFVAAIQQNVSDVVILRGTWAGIVQATGWTSTLDRNAAVSLVLQEQVSQPNHVLVLTQPRLIRHYHVLAATDTFPEPLSLGAPSWLPDEVFAAGISASHWWVLRGSTGEWIVDVRTEDGKLTGGFPLTHALAEIEIDEPVTKVCLLAMGSQLWVAFGRYLFLFEAAGKTPRRWVCETPIVGLEASAPFLASAVVARCKVGVAVFWCNDRLGDNIEVLAPAVECPFAAFLGNGVLVLLSSVAGAGGYMGQVIDLDRRGVHSRAEFFWQGDEPVAVVSTGRQDQFGIFTRHGEVQVQRVPVG